jgi:hypothetical protein
LAEELLEYRWRVVVDRLLRSRSARRSYLDPLDQVLEKGRDVDLAHDREHGTTSVGQKGVTVAWLVCTLEDHIVSNVSPLRGTTVDSGKKNFRMVKSHRVHVIPPGQGSHPGLVVQRRFGAASARVHGCNARLLVKLHSQEPDRV